jgi:hypothetical protein
MHGDYKYSDTVNLPLRLGFFFFSLRSDLGVGLLVLNLFGNENIAREARNRRDDTITSPDETHRHSSV